MRAQARRPQDKLATPKFFHFIFIFEKKKKEGTCSQGGDRAAR